MRGGGRAGFSEKKYYDFGENKLMPDVLTDNNKWRASTPTYTASGAATKLLFAPKQGNAMFNRTGRRTWISDIKINFMVEFPQAYSDAATWAGGVTKLIVLILLDKHCDKKSWTTTDAESVMQPDFMNGVAAPNSLKGLAWTSTQNWGRYRVLKKLTFTRASKEADLDGDTHYSNSVTNKKFKHKFATPIQVNYGETGNLGDEANVNDNGLRMIAFTENQSQAALNSSNEKCRLKYWGRVGFYDHK